MLSVGIIRYPGSNCDIDTYNYFNKWFNVYYIWHTQTELDFETKIDLLVIPGGFAFGDREYIKATEEYVINPGQMAIESAVTKIILNAANNKVPILGICNGFQILIKLKLLPGELKINKNNKFNCKNVVCSFIQNYSIYKTKLWIANKFGRYSLLDENMELCDNQIFLKYDNLPEIDSYNNIAGICNKEQNIFGMMPHPERNNTDFYPLLCEMLFKNSKRIKTQCLYYNKINELMNSEHISYKSTKKYLNNLPTEADWVVQGPGENAGIVDIGEDYCIAVRIESHNHPTFIDPFEGAATGVGGIMRDIFTMGARPIAILDFLRFGIDENSKELMHKAVEGISYYGNCVGVANVGGQWATAETYNKNPLVNVACIGIVKKENIIYGNAKDSDNILIYIGSKTGNEGIDGAAMASRSFNNNNNFENLKKNIQKSDPFLEKLLLEACLEIAEKKLAVGMQDMGAGGLLCASYEIVHRGRKKYNKNLGCKIFLDKVPIKYNMENINILISESQERMLLVANKNNTNQIFEILKKWDLEYAKIGIITNDNLYSIYDNNEIQYIENIDIKKEIIKEWVQDSNRLEDNLLDPLLISTGECINNLNNLNNLWSMYDSTIGNRTIKGRINLESQNHYSIIDIPENNKKLLITWAPITTSNWSLIETCSLICIPLLNKFNARPLCIVNCLNYGRPKYCINKLKEFIDELSEFSKIHKLPIVGGNVSLYNSTDNKCINPTPIVIILGLIS